MENLVWYDVTVYVILLTLSSIITIQWAAFGWLETGIQRPIQPKLLIAAFFGPTVLVIYDQHLKMNQLIPNQFYLISCTVIIPIILGIFYRYYVLAPGMAEFNRARVKLMYWTSRHYIPGKITPELAQLLENFPPALNTIKQLEKAINLQQRGTRIRMLENVIEINEDDYSWDNQITIRCLACQGKIKIHRLSDGGFGPCGFCGRPVNIKRNGNKVYIKVALLKPFWKVTDHNLSNVAIGHEELAFLYRMMGKTSQALESLNSAYLIAEPLASKHPENKEYTRTLSLIIFRRAEIEHICGENEKARIDYKKCIEIDESIGDTEETKLTKLLLSELP